MTTIAIIATSIITFTIGFFFGIYMAAKVIREGRIDNVKVVK
jgi:uncharacterized protein YneF (UPF0154 family)